MSTSLADAGAKRRQRATQRSRDEIKSAADIGEIPPILNPERRESCRNDLHRFLTTYFPHSTGLSPFGESQVRAIHRFEEAVLNGGRNLDLEPRGYVKSTRSENGTLWMVLYGHRKFPLFLGANDSMASIAIDSIKSELEDNDLLFEDFPEVCFPVRALEGKGQWRSSSQSHKGELTNIDWAAKRIVLPTINNVGGAVILTAGLLAATRGLRFKRPDGEQVRPDFVVIDDPQTDESARSQVQSATRMRILRQSVMRLGGHGKQIAAVINATVICPDDMVDQLADHAKHPEWPSVRSSALSNMPTESAIDKHWLGEYKRIRGDYNPEDPKGLRTAKEASSRYYREHQTAMDEGAVADWPNVPLEPDELSAIQHAMNVWVDDGEEVFWSEVMNKPRRTSVASPLNLERDDLLLRVNGYDQNAVPDGRGHIVFHVDVHDELLYYSVAAVSDSFSGDVISYGTWPEQPAKWFTMRGAKRTLTKMYRGVSNDEAIERGLKDLFSKLLSQPYMTEDGTALPVKLGLVDAGYKPAQVANAIRATDRNRIYTARGLGIGPTERTMREYDLTPKRVLRCGPTRDAVMWFLPREHIAGGVLRVHFDANAWKDAVVARLSQQADEGKWRFFGRTSYDHGPYVDHLLTERPTQVTAKGRTVNVWKVTSGDNHWFDTIVGCGVAASLSGAQLPTQQREQRKPAGLTRKRVRKLEW